MQKCGWIHCSCGSYIDDTSAKVKVGKRWYHEECAKEKQIIDDIVTKFIEQVNDASIPALRKVVNDIVFNELKPAEYVMFALDYAISHPYMKLTFPQGLYRICNSFDVIDAWKKKQNNEFMKHVNQNTFVANDVQATPLNKPKSNGGFSSILGRKSANG